DCSTLGPLLLPSTSCSFIRQHKTTSFRDTQRVSHDSLPAAQSSSSTLWSGSKKVMFSQNLITFSTEVDKGTFTVKNLQPKDKGLYFCAVSKHSDTNTCVS
uniref:Ig-like domain-containing protein n=1 Tax=Cyprinodon variegatus TaxID=28743 RepID=A0A3Q2GLQ3_CYPVA